MSVEVPHLHCGACGTAYVAHPTAPRTWPSRTVECSCTVLILAIGELGDNCAQDYTRAQQHCRVCHASFALHQVWWEGAEARMR